LKLKFMEIALGRNAWCECENIGRIKGSSKIFSCYEINKQYLLAFYSDRNISILETLSVNSCMLEPVDEWISIPPINSEIWEGEYDVGCVENHELLVNLMALM
jgi:hypothetical protein